MDRVQDYLRTRKAAPVAGQSDDQVQPNNKYQPGEQSTQTSIVESQLPSVSDDDSYAWLVLKQGSTTRRINFPPQTIENGTLQVRDVCKRALEVFDIPDGIVVQLSFNGTRLRDRRFCRDYNIKNDSVLECTLVPDDQLVENSEGYTFSKQRESHRNEVRVDQIISSTSVPSSSLPSENAAGYSSNLRSQPAPSRTGSNQHTNVTVDPDSQREDDGQAYKELLASFMELLDREMKIKEGSQNMLEALSTKKAKHTKEQRARVEAELLVSNQRIKDFQRTISNLQSSSSPTATVGSVEPRVPLRIQPLYPPSITDEDFDYITPKHLGVPKASSSGPRDLPNEFMFVKPSGFRPNSHFVGREPELVEIHKLLFDQKRRSKGTSAVLLQSLPGGGKTHLAREYVFTHRDMFPGGIFWLGAKSRAELTAGFWDIARQAGLKMSDEYNIGEFTTKVKLWFHTRKDWLLILDGIHFSDANSLKDLIPDAPDTSLIYTSTERSVEDNYHFLNPQVIKLPLLSAKEAQTLLLIEIDISEPTSDDLRWSMELVQKWRFLPFMIHFVAQRLIATGESLAHFTKKYRGFPTLGGTLNPYSEVMDYLKSLGAIEALNLLKIISFFSQHIPVEMILLGISSVDVPIKTSSPQSGRSLNNTLRILNKFALIDRNEYEANPQPRLDADLSADSIDVIRIHDIVQDFIVDSCRAEDQLSVWLHRAAALFCQSFSIALQQIKRTTNKGLVEDFQLFEIHGQKLLDHLQRQAKKESTTSGWQATVQRSLTIIKLEIEKRTTSFTKIDMFATSVFDRSSSSNSSAPSSPTKEVGQAKSESDLESIASIEDDIFSTAGSLSTNSTVSSIRFNVIELIVGKFIEDPELSALYDEAINRMTSERFVRNQRRLLKKFFLDLRPYTKTSIEQQAIHILRGRRERSSIAEAIWSILNPSNKSRHAQMAALLAQKPDKQSQLDRLLGGENSTDVTNKEPENLSEESESSDSETSASGDEENIYPNVEMATEFIISGAPFKQYKCNLRGFLRLDASPAKLQELVVTGDIVAVTKLLSTRFEEVAELEFDWLHELLDIGSSFEEMAILLIAGEQASPWVPLDHPVSVNFLPSIDFHQPHCVHSGGQKLDTTPRTISGLSGDVTGIPLIHDLGLHEIVSGLCGVAGAIPLDPNQDNHNWMSMVQFNEDSTIGRVRYACEETLGIPMNYAPVLRIIDALQRVYNAAGYLQECGVCCDTFTVLVFRYNRPPFGIPCVEACPIQFSRIGELLRALESWIVSNEDERTEHLRSAAWAAQSIISDVSDEYSEITELDPVGWLDDCAIATQVLSLGILSYVQGHAGNIHPEFLVNPLHELHLLGNSIQEPRAHIVFGLLQLTCIGDMLQKPVLVFQTVGGNDAPLSSNSVDNGIKYDIFASPEDFADTWGPARFVVNTGAYQTNSRSLWAVEVCGGIITRTDVTSRKLHWSEHGRPSFSKPFDSREKILIGGVTVNPSCPLDEAESWRHPATNAYLGHLGTRPEAWDRQEMQGGVQGGQYAVVQFNVTYVKQPGVTLKQQQLSLPPHLIDIAFLNSTCGLQISFCTGVARRVALRTLLADVMVDFVESKFPRPSQWEALKSTQCIVQNFRAGNIQKWFEGLTTEEGESVAHIVRSMLEFLKDTGIDRNDEELVIAWIRKDSPDSSLRVRCEKSSLWARILADSEDCATFACITPMCLEIEKHKCRGLKIAPWHNVSTLLDTAVAPQLSSREVMRVVDTLTPFKLEHHVSYWIGKSGSNLIAKVWIVGSEEPRLVVRQKVIPEKYRSRLPRAMVERLGRLREQQVSNAVASQVVILADLPQ